MLREYHKYNDEELEYLREISPTRTNKEIAELFNEKFNLNKTKRQISEYRKKNNIPSKYSNICDLNDGTFKKGLESWNKGKKGYIGANKTSFKKGNKAHNCVEIGSERIVPDGYTEVKIADGKNQKNWKAKHKIVWENHNGEIPPGHVVIFADRDKSNFDIDNLMLISKKQLLIMNRNSLIKDDAELTKLGLAIAEIKIKIVEKIRE